MFWLKYLNYKFTRINFALIMIINSRKRSQVWKISNEWLTEKTSYWCCTCLHVQHTTNFGFIEKFVGDIQSGNTSLELDFSDHSLEPAHVPYPYRTTFHHQPSPWKLIIVIPFQFSSHGRSKSDKMFLILYWRVPRYTYLYVL